MALQAQIAGKTTMAFESLRNPTDTQGNPTFVSARRVQGGKVLNLAKASVSETGEKEVSSICTHLHIFVVNEKYL